MNTEKFLFRYILVAPAHELRAGLEILMFYGIVTSKNIPVPALTRKI